MSETKTHWKKQDNPDYLGAYSLLGTETEELTVKITKVGAGLVKSVQNPDGDTCRIAYLEGQKPLILNTTNSKILERIYNTPFIEDWIGKSFTLYVKKIKVAGDLMDALRIREVAPVVELPELKPDTDMWDKVVKALLYGYSINDIKKKYKLSESNENQLKDAIKDKV